MSTETMIERGRPEFVGIDLASKPDVSIEHEVLITGDGGTSM